MAIASKPVKDTQVKRPDVFKAALAIGLGAGMMGYVLARTAAHTLGHRSMNKDEVMGKWLQMKGKVKARWGDLTDDEIARTEGRLEELAGQIQQRYGGLKEDILAQLRTYRVAD